MSRSPQLGLSRRLKLLKHFITIFRLARPSHGHAVLQGADPNAAWAARSSSSGGRGNKKIRSRIHTQAKVRF